VSDVSRQRKKFSLTARLSVNVGTTYVKGTSSLPLQNNITSYLRFVFESLFILELFLHYFGLTGTVRVKNQ